MSQPGPITAALEEEVTRVLRQRGLVVWLDKDGHYTPYVDALVERHTRGEFFAPVVPFRGSYLAMMLALAPYGNGLDPEPLLLHMPGHTEESIRHTPILELYTAGFRFRKALATLIREAASGRVGPAELEHYLASDSVSLEAADAWLQHTTSQPSEGLAGYLDSLTLEWLVDGLVGKDKVLQERVIPVLTVSHRHRPQANITRYTLEAEALPEVLGYSRLRLRVMPSLQLHFVGAQTISLALRVPERPDVYVTLKEAINAEVHNQELRLAIGDPWVEVLFDLRGPYDERTRVELFHPEGLEQIEPHTIDAYFNVAGTGQRDDGAPVALTQTDAWQDHFEDPTIRGVFLHLQEHGSLPEQELHQMLGSPRQVRRFALGFDTYVQQVPFAVRIETTSSGKRYVKHS